MKRIAPKKLSISLTTVRPLDARAAVRGGLSIRTHDLALSICDVSLQCVTAACALTVVVGCVASVACTPTTTL